MIVEKSNDGKQIEEQKSKTKQVVAEKPPPKIIVAAPDKFDLMMTMHCNHNKENSGVSNNLPKNQSMEALSDKETSCGGIVASKGDSAGGEPKNRKSSISVDSNLSFEFAETQQEPCIAYKFEY